MLENVINGEEHKSFASLREDLSNRLDAFIVRGPRKSYLPATGSKLSRKVVFGV
jgi:hypothetical protein